MLWEDDNPVLLPRETPNISSPDERPDVWLWTARYQNKAIARFNMAAVRITLGHPRFKLPYPIAATMRELAPDRAWFHAPAEVFREKYLEKLEDVGFERIIGKLRALHEDTGQPLVLLCFERVGEDCHRFQLATWLESQGLPEPVWELAE